jgi:hypothetical protein
MQTSAHRISWLILAATTAAVVSSGCSASGSTSPHQLAALSPHPSASVSAVATNSPRPADQKTAEAAVVREYFQVVNRLPVDMDAPAIDALTKPSCPCRKLARSIREESARHREYYGRNAINAIRANVDGQALGDVLVDFDTTASGVRSTTGAIITRTKPRRHVNLDFTVVRYGGRWLIERIDEV